MSSLKAFFRFRFRYATGLGQLRFLLRSDQGGIVKFILAVLLAIFVLGTFVGTYVLLAFFIQWTASEQGCPELMPRIMLSAAQILLLITSFFSAFNMMFGGSDREFMASLPLREKDMFLVNLFTAYLTELATAALTVLPVVIIYGVFNGMSLGLWLYGLLGILLFPVFPLCIASILMLLIMLSTGRSQHKEMLITFFGVLFLIAILLFNVYMNSGSFAQTMENGAFESFLKNRAEGIRTVSYLLPGAGFLAGALTESGMRALWHFAGLLGIALLPGVLAVLLGSRYYFTVLRQLSSSASGKKKKLSGRDFRAGSPVKAMFFKEWKLALRSPVYAMNGLFNIVAGPILVVFLFLSKSGEEEQGWGFLAGFLERYPAAAVAAMTAMIIIVGGMGMISSTTISREGAAFWICKTIPVPVRTQTAGRWLTGLSMYGLCAVLMLIAFFVFLPLNLWHMLAAAVLSLAAGPALVSLQMMPDVAKPKLVWNKEQEAMKQNFNGLFAMLFAVLFALLAAAPLAIVAFGLWPAWMGYGITFVIEAGLGAGTVIGLFQMAERRFAITW